jgi:hypothetical protein
MIWLKRVRGGVEAEIMLVPRSLIDVEIYSQAFTVIHTMGHSPFSKLRNGQCDDHAQILSHFHYPKADSDLFGVAY